MRLKLCLLPSLLLIVFLAGCTAGNLNRHTGPAAVQHIVIVWLREPGNTTHRQMLIEASKQLTEIPGVISVEGGSVITSGRAVVDSSFDVALIFTLQDQQTLAEYVHHPLHRKLLAEVIKPLIERYRVYDVELHLFGQ